MMRVISLTTDFGIGDHEAGVLKGVIWEICPDAKIADLSHDVTRHNVLEGALLLGRSTPYFPEGSIHVAVVDPGVGTARRGMAARLGDQWYVGPDNGLCTLMFQRAKRLNLPVEMAALENPRYFLPEVTAIFHGRDVFAPVAAHLAAGAALKDLGSPITDPVLLDLPEAVRTGHGWRGQVIHVDHFGNLATNIRMDQLTGSHSAVTVRLSGVELHGLAQAFGDGAPGSLVALIDSSGWLAVSVVNGSAAQRLSAGMGTAVEVELESRQDRE